MASHGARLIWLRLLGFVLAGVVLHFALFYWPLVILDLEAAVFLGTGVIGFVMGALGVAYLVWIGLQLIFARPREDAPYMSTVWHGDEVVGEITSSGHGYRVDKTIGLGMVRTDLAVAGAELEVEIFGKRCRAVVQADEPLWDPQNERLRA